MCDFSSKVWDLAATGGEETNLEYLSGSRVDFYIHKCFQSKGSLFQTGISNLAFIQHPKCLIL